MTPRYRDPAPSRATSRRPQLATLIAQTVTAIPPAPAAANSFVASSLPRVIW